MSTLPKLKSLTQNTLLFGISSFGTKFLTFFLVSIYTKELSTAEFGTIDILTTTVQLLIPVLTINIQDAVLRFSLDKNHFSSDVIRVGLRTLLIGSVVLGIFVLILCNIPFIPLEINYWILLYLSFISGGLLNVLSMYLKSQNKVKTLAFWGLINTVITFASTIILLCFFHLGVNGYIISVLSGSIIGNIGMIISGKVFIDIKHSNYSKALFTSMLAYSSPLIANSLGWWVNTASDRYILTFFSGADVNGIYAVSYKIPSILSAVQSVFYNAWSVSAITEFDKDDSDGFIGEVYSAYAYISILFASFIMLFNIIIAKFMYSYEFFSAWQFVPFLLTGTVFNGLGLFNGCIFTAVKKTKEVSVSTILGAVINTVLNFLLIPFIGPYGAAISTMIGYISIWLIRTIKLRKIIKMKVNWCLQIIFIILLVIQSFIATLNENMIYQIPFFIFLLVIGKNYFSTIIKMLKSKILKKKT